MKYKDFILKREIVEAVRLEGLESVPSPFAEKHGEDEVPDFSEFPELGEQFLKQTVENEISLRRSAKEYQELIEEHEAPKRERQKKLELVRPVVESYVRGNLQHPYSIHEDAFLAYVSNQTIDKYGSQIGEQTVPQNNSGSELEKLLSKSRVTFLSNQLSMDEMVIRQIHDLGIAPMLK